MMQEFGFYKLNEYQDKLLLKAQEQKVSWIGRRMALLCRKAVLKTYKQNVIDANVKNLKMRFHLRDNVSERKFLFMPQFFDVFEHNLIKNKLPEDGVFIDIGANSGIYTLTAAKYMSDKGKVISVEANPEVVKRLEYNVELNGKSNIVTIVPIGVSDKDGVFSLCLDPTNLGGSSIALGRSANNNSNNIEIPCRPLLSVIRDNKIKKIDILKVDIEGAEDKALIPFLKNADKSLFPKFIILENSTNDWKMDLQSYLKDAEYEMIKETRMNLIFKLS